MREVSFTAGFPKLTYGSRGEKANTSILLPVQGVLICAGEEGG